MRDIHEHGTIVKLIPSKRSAEDIKNWCIENNIRCINEDDLHCTVLFSRAPCKHLARLDEATLLAPARIVGWKRLGNALTLELYAPKINRLHEWMINRGGTHDYPEFIAHTSVTYDWDNDQLPSKFPNMIVEFTRLVVDGIDPKFAESSTTS